MMFFRAGRLGSILSLHSGGVRLHIDTHMEKDTQKQFQNFG
jgi:hypothetical protein